jgi:hypothetical protein
MENILKIIYDKSLNNKIININDINKILELLIIEKKLGDYIFDINVQPIRSNNLASYSYYSKNITIYSQTIETMLKNIEVNMLNLNDFEKKLYKNLALLQIILHEIEHANQAKISYTDNTLEAFIIRISYTVSDCYFESLYEYSPQERLAEIKSYREIISLMSYINNKLEKLPLILETEKLQRQLRGYHYSKEIISSPLITFFKQGKKELILQSFDWYHTDSLNTVYNIYNLNERFNYGFPISLEEYSDNMKKLVLSLNNNFNNRTNFKK